MRRTVPGSTAHAGCATAAVCCGWWVWQQVERCHPPAGVKQSPMVAEPLNRAAFPRPGVLATPQHTTTHMRVPNDPKVGRGAAPPPSPAMEKKLTTRTLATPSLAPPSHAGYIAGQLKFGINHEAPLSTTGRAAKRWGLNTVLIVNTNNKQQ